MCVINWYGEENSNKASLGNVCLLAQAVSKCQHLKYISSNYNIQGRQTASEDSPTFIYFTLLAVILPVFINPVF